MSRSIRLPMVAHIVADLDDLAVEVPRRGTRPLVRRMSFTFRRALTRSRTYSFAAIGALLLGVMACSDSDDPVTGPTPEPVAAYDLVYERRPSNGDADIRRLSPATGASTTLPLVVTIPGTFARDVAPSPDGMRVAFTVAWYPEGGSTLDGDIYVANIDGTGLRRLTTAEELDDQPEWSPDGTRIAFRSKRSGNPDIWVMGANGTAQTNLTDDFLPATSSESGPAWSPDGSRIAYASDIDSFAYAKLWTMRVDGRDKRRVLPGSVGTFEIDLEPSWSPDGGHIAFRRIADDVPTRSDIMIATIATGAVTRIPLDGVQALPAWSPDGSRIAFTSNHQGLYSDIYTMRLDGTGIDRHTVGSDENTHPRWLRAVGAAGRVAKR